MGTSGSEAAEKGAREVEGGVVLGYPENRRLKAVRVGYRRPEMTRLNMAGVAEKRQRVGQSTEI